MQEKVTKLKIKNQALKNKREILQMRLEMSSAHMNFPSQTLPIGPAGTSGSTHPMAFDPLL
ncbi:hypothetical protein VP01_6911g1 [Puccinia sorghi]|uniref:Uncharacterized protein n=1 Tax=Puccinia sorghi TaxID=27349 RepID=A0A0L6UE53_9BASI|nr:hypothetical protein VP01_6911g1 [Puccinia sorghi]